VAVPVLIADDDDDVRLVLSELLTDECYLVCTATDGQGALAILRESAAPLVVLLDYMMPPPDGAAILADVAKDTTLARHAYILCTAADRTLPLRVVKLLTDLGVRVLPKPFNLEEVLAAVATACERIADARAPHLEQGASLGSDQPAIVSRSRAARARARTS
jgi:CheY-like chemotaxis protein